MESKYNTESDELKQLALRINNGTTVNEIIAENPYYKKYIRTLKLLEESNTKNKKRSKMTLGLWIYDPNELYNNAILKTIPEELTVYYKSLSKKDSGWWDDYQQEDIIVLNNYRGEIDHRTLCNVIDWTTASVSRRHKCDIPLRSKVIIIISKLSPREAYKKEQEYDHERLLRRVKIYEITHNEYQIIIPSWDKILECWVNEESL